MIDDTINIMKKIDGISLPLLKILYSIQPIENIRLVNTQIKVAILCDDCVLFMMKVL